MEKVYLDSNATTEVHPEVLDTMLPFYREAYGNASSIHAYGRAAKKHLEKSRGKVARLIGAEAPDEIVFTSGGTEADNFAIKGTAHALRGQGNHIITSSVEHHAVLNSCKYLEGQGFRVTYLDVDRYGKIDLGQLRKSIKEETILISVMSANNETGTIMPVEEIGKIASEKGVIFHTDAVQMIGKMPFDVKKSGAQLVSVAAHKIHGPKGVGALYVKRGTDIDPYQHGGSQENKYRAGTENMPGIVGFAAACEIAQERGLEQYEKGANLRDMLHEGIKDRMKEVELNGHPEQRLPNTLNVSFRGVEGESVVINLDLEGIAVSTGSACTAGNQEVSHVLKSMQIDPQYLGGSVRFSLSSYTKEADIDYVLAKLPPIIERLRGIGQK